jgi:hypothetical protein
VESGQTRFDLQCYLYLEGVDVGLAHDTTSGCSEGICQMFRQSMKVKQDEPFDLKTNDLYVEDEDIGIERNTMLDLEFRT